MFWKMIYNGLFIPILWILLYAGSMFNAKIRRGIRGRDNLFGDLERRTATLHGPVRLWFHSSSLGEFEQAKPIIAAIKRSSPSVDIVATFFSPSGFDHSKNYKFADVITYLPFDSHKNAKRFVELLRPTVAIMVRYDIWPNFIWRLHRKNIPTFIANATMRESSLRALPLIRQFHSSLFSCFTSILTVSEKDKSLFQTFSPDHVRIEAIGDSRFDQVLTRSHEAGSKRLLADAVVHGKKVFIVGQSWEEDEEVIVPVLLKVQSQEQNLLTLIVPHEPTVDHLDQLEDRLRGTTSVIRFSEITNYHGEQVIIVDSVGILVPLYQYAHVAYVGGSFRQGVHNVLEPAVFGCPVLFGPRHTNSQEAVSLSQNGGGFTVENERDLYRSLRTLLDDEERRTFAGTVARNFVLGNCGATERFLQFLQPYLQR